MAKSKGDIMFLAKNTLKLGKNTKYSGSQTNTYGEAYSHAQYPGLL